ncbi:reverse transcriptase domain-containing protein [Kocuria salsicia]|uniref:Reverse transcriptase domain-containing protein n=1 Tax=Kocuria salsicia TaxID=664639 RepID=A0ABV3KDL9_9MICC
MGQLEKNIKSIAQERIRRIERARSSHHDEYHRFSRRSTQVEVKAKFPNPDSWNFRNDFNPFKVRAKSEVYEYTIKKALSKNTYELLQPVEFNVGKTGGGSRTITNFGIPDEAVSRLVYTSLMTKNKTALSSRSYAYRKDVNVFDAIDYISREWREFSRLYVAEHDLHDYFGSIQHSFIEQSISDLNLHATPRERSILKLFMNYPEPQFLGGNLTHEERPRGRGIPQGTSSSLFLSNVALTPLDRRLERLGVGFARFSDDLLIWGADYNAVVSAVTELLSWTEESGVQISHGKSPGIQIMNRFEVNSEMKTTDAIVFLSHKINLRSARISDRSINNLKRNVKRLIYANLIREPLRNTQNPVQLREGIDRDYLTFVSQLRRLIYGSLSEAQVRRLLTAPVAPKVRFTGRVAQFPTISTLEDWKEFDAWVLRQVAGALKKRSKIINAQMKFADYPMPWAERPQKLRNLTMRSTRNGSLVNASLPSAHKMAKLVKKTTSIHGMHVLETPHSIY